MCIRDRGGTLLAGIGAASADEAETQPRIGGVHRLRRGHGVIERDADVLIPVSYTHLDVYKRQSLGSALNMMEFPLPGLIYTAHAQAVAMPFS